MAYIKNFIVEKINILVSLIRYFFLSVLLSVCHSVCLSFYLYILLSVSPSVCLSLYLSFLISVSPYICLSLCPSVCLSVGNDTGCISKISFPLTEYRPCFCFRLFFSVVDILTFTHSHHYTFRLNE